MKNRLKKSGFSIIEMLMALLIISVIVSASMPGITQKRSGIGPIWNQNGSYIYNTNNGKVGIGNNNPAYKLTIGNPNSDSDQSVIFTYNTGGGLPAGFPTGSGTRFLWSPKNLALRIGHVNATQWDTLYQKTAVIGGESNNADIFNFYYKYASAIGGYNNTASGEKSICFGGYNNIASADSSIATVGGYENNIKYKMTSAFGGYNNTINAFGSNIVGGQNSLIDVNAYRSGIFGGANNTIDGDYSNIFASDYSDISMNNSFIAGCSHCNTTTSDQTVVLASENSTASGHNSSAVSSVNSTASGVNSIVMSAYNSTASGTNSIAMGRNMKVTGNDSLLMGNSNSLVTLANANSAGFYVNNLYLKSGAGPIAWASDERLKNILGDYKLGLKEIAQLKIITFKYKNMFGLDHIHEKTGMVAQDVIKAFPMAKKPAAMGKGYLTYDIFPVQLAMINATKELYHRNIELKQKNIELKQKNKKLKEKIQYLKEELNEISDQ